MRRVERHAGDAERPVGLEDHREHESRDVLALALEHHRVRLHERVLQRLDHAEFRVVLVLEHPAERITARVQYLYYLQEYHFFQ